MSIKFFSSFNDAKHFLSKLKAMHKVVAVYDTHLWFYAFIQQLRIDYCGNPYFFQEKNLHVASVDISNVFCLSVALLRAVLNIISSTRVENNAIEFYSSFYLLFISSFFFRRLCYLPNEILEDSFWSRLSAM